MGLLNAPLTDVLGPFLMTCKPFVQVRLQLQMSIPTRPPTIAVRSTAKASGSPAQCDATYVTRNVTLRIHGNGLFFPAHGSLSGARLRNIVQMAQQVDMNLLARSLFRFFEGGQRGGCPVINDL